MRRSSGAKNVKLVRGRVMGSLTQRFILWRAGMGSGNIMTICLLRLICIILILDIGQSVTHLFEPDTLWFMVATLNLLVKMASNQIMILIGKKF